LLDLPAAFHRASFVDVQNVTWYTAGNPQPHLAYTDLVFAELYVLLKQGDGLLDARVIGAVVLVAGLHARVEEAVQCGPVEDERRRSRWLGVHEV
jgi:hypothetical protein